MCEPGNVCGMPYPFATQKASVVPSPQETSTEVSCACVSGSFMLPRVGVTVSPEVERVNEVWIEVLEGVVEALEVDALPTVICVDALPCWFALSVMVSVTVYDPAPLYVWE